MSRPLTPLLLVSAAALSFVPAAALAIDISSNLAQATGGVESAAGDRWLASSFATDATAYTLTSVTMLLANTSSGSAQVVLYSSGGLEPGSIVGVLTSPASYSSQLSATTFTSGSIALTPNTTYWVVLRAVSGEFQWAWAGDSGGTGAGFQHTWGVSPDAGASWWTHDAYPTQMSVSVSTGAACYANCDASTANPILNVNDFTCFLNRFAAGDAYANCDGSTLAPVLNVNDFTCFLNKYAAGCE